MMVKKLKVQAEDKQLANAVRTSAQQIWQAGLGAFAKAQEEGGRVFAKLVKEGTELQKRTQKLAEDKTSDVTSTVSKMAGDVGKQASGSWDKLEQVFEERVARALSSIGVPTRGDIDDLNRRIEQLSAAVAQLSVARAVDVVTAATKPAVKRVAKVSAAAAKGNGEAEQAAGTKSATKPATAKPVTAAIFPTSASRTAAVKPAARQASKSQTSPK
jgi:poly(hydroxyalkanoate) granule-associated protein